MKRHVCVALVLAVLTACGGDSATAPKASVAGAYTLRTVNGAAVPAVVYQDTQEKDELTSGTITLNSDNSWSGTLTLRGTLLTDGSSTTIPVPANGTYTVSNGSITLTQGGGGQLTGTVGGGTLSFGADLGLGVPLTLVFMK